MTPTFAVNWKRSIQPRKQRKFRYNAPLHIQQKFMHAHLSKDLRTKYGTRSVQVRKGDKVRVLRGTPAKKEGKVDRVSITRGKVYVSGVEYLKKDGTKLLLPLQPSNLLIIDFDLSDARRKQKFQKKVDVKKALVAGKSIPLRKLEVREGGGELAQSKERSNLGSEAVRRRGEAQ